MDSNLIFSSHGQKVRVMNGLNSPPPSLDFVSIRDEPDFVKPYTAKCELCKESLLNPMQTQCGHRLCADCLDRHFVKYGDPSMCPYKEEDCTEISRGDKSVFPDFVLIKELKRKDVYCRHKSRGCTAIIKLGVRKVHEEQCEYGRVDCPFAQYGCLSRPNISSLDQHVKECIFTPRKCPQCGDLIAKKTLKDHVSNQCRKGVIPCPYGCGKSPILREEMEGHLGFCTSKPSECQYARMGCQFLGTEDAIKKHVQEETDMHLQLVTNHCEQLEKKMDDNNQAQQETQVNSNKRIKSLEEKCKNVVQRCSRQEHRMKETEKLIVDQEDTIQELVRKVGPGAGLTINGTPPTSSTGHKECNKKAELLTKAVSELEQKLSQTSQEKQKLQEQVQQLSQKVSNYDLRFQVLETASYDGILLWKIRDYRRRKMDAKGGGILSLYSQPFYTSHHGYRMCARVYLNGDGMGVNTHMSLFFVVMKGEYDPLLKWPFRQRVSLMLMDQTQSGRHIVDTFRPDPSSSSFQMPRTDMNVASGCPLFISHGILEAPDSPYLKNDTIFIKIAVDLPETPF